MHRRMLSPFMGNQRVLNAERHINWQRQSDDVAGGAFVSCQISRADEQVVGLSEDFEGGE